MDLVWQEIGISVQHISESSVPDRYQLICDKQWLQTLEQKRKIGDFPILEDLDRRAHPTGTLEHPWTRIMVQNYRKQPQLIVFPLPRQPTRLTGVTADELGTGVPDSCNLPLTYSQAVSYVTNINFRNLWEAAYKKYQASHVKHCKRSPNASQKSQLNSPLAQCCLLPHDAVLKELIQRIFNCPVVHCKLDRFKEASLDSAPSASECHSNVLPAIVAIETSAFFSVFFYPPAIVTNLNDCLTYSPAMLSKSYNKPLFLVYQLVQLFSAFQSVGLFLGDIRLHDIHMRDNLWLQVVPCLEANMLQQTFEDCQNFGTSPSETATGADIDLAAADSGDYDVGDGDDYSASTRIDLKFAYDLDRFSLREYCDMWCNGQLSNYDYLTVLNNAAGRSLSNPAYHHIMPWVTDFAARSGANWRDLSKSKYRLNKGDIHLDLMFAHAVNQHTQNPEMAAFQEVPHHVSDFLSDITYFVYMARRTAQQILRAHVRPIWVPAEYPVSIQRLQEWTPDECIPEFYSDPMVFKSIHEDLPDLELPAWSSCPEDFIYKHREALESQYVSERLQHWIDLNFGYKLTGRAAIKSKNVCLSVVDQHKNLCQRGIVQLFNQPHPPKRFQSIWFGRTAPRLQHLYNTSSSLKTASSTTNRHGPPVTEKYVQKLSTSIENLNVSSTTDNIVTEASTRPSMPMPAGNSPKPSSRGSHSSNNEATMSTSANFYQSTNFIELPKDYNPSALLQNLETMQAFLERIFPKQKSAHNAQEKMANNDLLFEENSEEHSFTNQLFADVNPLSTPNAQQAKVKNLLVPSTSLHLKRRSQKQILSEKRVRELQVMGCLIVEIFALQRLRPLMMNSCHAAFEERLQACRTVAELYKQEIPKCLRSMVQVLLQADTARESVTEQGLPPPSAAQLLEPIFSNTLIPFPNTYYPIYALIRALQAFDFDRTLLELHTHFSCNGKECSRYSELDRKRVLFERKLAECKVMSCCAHIEHLLEPVAYEQFSSVELLLPHVIDLLTADQTSILTAWNLFDPVAQALGLTKTQKYLLMPIMKLYDVENVEHNIGGGSGRSPTRSASGNNSCGGVNQLRFSTSSSFKSRKSVKLYHHSFLLRLIVRFGLRCFLQHFIAPLIEAVGGYKEPEDGNGFHYHQTSSSIEESNRRTSKNLNFIADETENSITLMSPDGLLDTELDDATLSVDNPVSHMKKELEDVFSFDDDAGSDRISNSGTAENKSIDSFEMRLAPAEEATEDSDCLMSEVTTEKLAISEIIYGEKISGSGSHDDADKISINSQTANDFSSAVTAGGTHLGPKSPTIAIPSSAFRRTYQLNAIDCDIGSRKSIDSFEILTQAVEEQEQHQQQLIISATDSTKSTATTHTTSQEATLSDSLQASVISKLSEAKAMQNNRISEMSAESLIWLSHRLGPALTSRYITRNLLKMLTLCYVGQENLLPQNYELEEGESLNYFSIADARVAGDRSAARVLECLMSIAALFGEEVILLQYFPHISELIALCQKRVTVSLEGAIISSLQLLKFILPCLMDTTIMEHLKDIILDSIILPIVRLLGSTQLLMPSGYLGRSVLARKLLDAVYALCVRIGPDMSKELICVPALSQFFLIFDKAYGIAENFSYLHRGNEINIATNISPPNFIFGDKHNQLTDFQEHTRENEELRDVFSPALAHIAYLSFLRFLGEAIMQRTLYNLEFILTLCHEFEQPNYQSADDTAASRCSSDSNNSPGAADAEGDAPPNNLEPMSANSFGTNIVGNRIEVASPSAAKHHKKPAIIGHMEALDMVAYKFDQVPTKRHLKGNWLAYWRHEISRPEKDFSLNLKQIKLQSFSGHTNSVRAIVALDNENSFMSASKDKTVKLWSLRSEGDGKKISSCQFTYTAHKKSIHSLAFLDAMRLVVSCDSGIHIWDPFIGRPLDILDSPKHNPVTVVKCLPSPSPLIVAGTAESSVRIIDSRCMQYVNEWRVSAAHLSNATVRCLTIAPSGNWLGVGLSSGNLVMLDTRTGVLMNNWRPMECDLLQLTAASDQQLVSSALDHSLAVWHATDGRLHYQLKPPPEPAHFLQTFGSELVFATTGNRIGIYSDLSSSHAAYSVTKLRSETFRGVLTSLAVLPLNRTFLVGNESGNIVLLC